MPFAAWIYPGRAVPLESSPMSSMTSRSESGSRREAPVIAALTAAGALLRLWSIGRLGLVHFDEGIYAMAGTWVLSPRGLAGLDPTVISYAPPGFPALVGLAYGAFGVGDITAILVSIVAGTLTIPVAGWLACRTFGPGAGAAASAFAALSGPHVAFSRMALTDASFLLAWLIAIGLGQRFLERPGPARAAAMGIGVGVAQLFKYNGWLAGAVVALSAAAWTLSRAEDRRPRRQAELWGWGLFAALLAAAVYWPWFRFVEDHGGYGALLAHQRGYLGGLSSWMAHLAVQLEQDRALSGGFPWMVLTGLAGSIAMMVATGGFRHGLAPMNVVNALALAAFCAFMFGVTTMAFCCAVAGLARYRSAPRSLFVLGIGWAAMAALTPFYHPYARLFLPLQAMSWLLLGGLFAEGRAMLERTGRAGQRAVAGIPMASMAIAAGLWIGPVLIAVLSPYWEPARNIVELLAPSDSLRRGCRSLAETLRKVPAPLRAYARPPVTFYLAGVTSIAPQPTMEALLKPREPGAWALLDSAMVRQEGGLRGRLGGAGDRWDLASEVATTLNWPTLLDIDPGAASRRLVDRSAPLLLFRPKPAGATR